MKKRTREGIQSEGVTRRVETESDAVIVLHVSKAIVNSYAPPFCLMVGGGGAVITSRSGVTSGARCSG